jgi:hypothetical protein
MAQFDIRLADGIWDGDPLPEDAPAWCSDIGRLIEAARAADGPDDELAAESAIVAMMAEAIAAAAADGDDAEPVVPPPPGAPGLVMAGAPEGTPAAGDEGPEAVETAADAGIVALLAPDVSDAAEAAATGVPPVIGPGHDGATHRLNSSARKLNGTARPADDEVAGAEVVDLATGRRAPSRRPADDPDLVALLTSRNDTAAETRAIAALAALTASTGDGPPATPPTATDHAGDGEEWAGLRLARRLVAVKAVAVTTAVVVGITAAAATTGIVAKVVVDPPRSLRSDPTIVVTTTTVDDDDEAGGGSSRSGQNQDSEATMTPARQLPLLLDCMRNFDFGCPEASLGLDVTTSSTSSTSTTATTAPPTTTTPEPSVTSTAPTTATTVETSPTTSTTTTSTTTTTAPTTETTAGLDPGASPVSTPGKGSSHRRK